MSEEKKCCMCGAKLCRYNNTGKCYHHSCRTDNIMPRVSTPEIMIPETYGLFNPSILSDDEKEAYEACGINIDSDQVIPLSFGNEKTCQPFELA